MARHAPLDLRERAAAIAGRPLLPNQVHQFNKYLELLKKWGSVHRLIGSTDSAWIVENLFLDSLLFLRLLPGTAHSVMDLGAGAGVPGVPIKIARPEIRLTLVESKQRKVSFLSTVVRELELTDTRVVNARAESAPAELLGAFDTVVMRCAGPSHRLVPFALRFLRPGGVVIKSASPTPGERQALNMVRVSGVKAGAQRTFEVYRHPS